jgi:hypothetical protein
MDREDTLGEASMLLLPLIVTALAAQDLSELSIGQRVRVHFMAPAPALALSIPLAGPRLGEGHIAGTLTDYRPFESVAVERKGWIAGIGPTSHRTVDWVYITRIETAQPRNALNVIRGATGGFGAALVLTAMSMLIIRPFCDAPPGAGSECPGFWSTTGRIAVYSVPLGAVVGYFSTRWKPVYRRQGPHV